MSDTDLVTGDKLLTAQVTQCEWGMIEGVLSAAGLGWVADNVRRRWQDKYVNEYHEQWARERKDEQEKAAAHDRDRL